MNERTLTDTQIKAAFVARSEGSISHDLAGRIHAETSRTRQASRLVVLTGGLSGNASAQRLLWAAAIAHVCERYGVDDDDAVSLVLTHGINPPEMIQ